MLASLFERCMKRRGVRDGDTYDWEKTDGVAIHTGQSNLTSNIQSQMQMKNEQIQGNMTLMTTTVAGSNGSGMEYVCIG